MERDIQGPVFHHQSRVAGGPNGPGHGISMCRPGGEGFENQKVESPLQEIERGGHGVPRNCSEEPYGGSPRIVSRTDVGARLKFTQGLPIVDERHWAQDRPPVSPCARGTELVCPSQALPWPTR